MRFLALDMVARGGFAGCLRVAIMISVARSMVARPVCVGV